MSEQNSLKELYRTAQTTADLDLFLYTGLPIVGRGGLVSIVADVTFDRLVQTCKKQKELAVEMLEPSVLFDAIRHMKFQFYNYFITGLYDGSGTTKVQHLGIIYANFFYTLDWQLHQNFCNNGQCGYYPSAAFVKRLCDFDNVDFSKFQLYRFAYDHRNTFVFADSEQPELLQHTLDFINSN